MGFIKEFKEFATKGNVVDLAIGIIIGAAFGKIVGSFIDDVVTPLILKPALDAANLNSIKDLTVLGTVKYGNFLSTIINFLIVALALFMVIKAINKMKRKKESAEPPPLSTTDKLLTEIRDALKK
jgi:large conductance mechanosensitive channel